MDLRISRKLIVRLGTLVISIGWAITILLASRSLPIGLEVGEMTSLASVSCIVTMTDGEHETDPQQMCKGYLGFLIPRGASSFRFKFKSVDLHFEFPLESVKFFGLPLLKPRQISCFYMEPKIYRTAPSDDHPLQVCCDNEADLNLPNVFPFALRVIRSILFFVAFLPLGVWLISFFVFRVGRRALELGDRALKMPTVWIVLVLICSFLILPDPVTAAVPGLDNSWVWLFNKFAFSGGIGRDFVFTYGPLGFVITPQLTMRNVLVGIVFNSLFLTVAAWLLLLLHRLAQTRDERMCVYLLLVTWILPWPNGMEWRWCVIAVSMTLIAVWGQRIDMRLRLWMCMIAALLATVQSFVKFSNCITVVFQQIVLMILFVLKDRGRGAWGCLIYVVTITLAFLGLAWVLFPSFASFGTWIKGSMEIATGYNLYMGCIRPPTDFIVPFASVTAVLVFWLLEQDNRIQRGLLWLSVVPILFCSYKYAVVRQSVEPMLMLLMVLSLLLSCLVDAFRKNGLRVFGMCFCLLFVTRFCLSGQYEVSGLSLRNLVRTFCPADATRRVKSVESSEHRCARLSQVLCQSIGTNAVMCVGSDFGSLMFEEYNLVPFPATQDYSAYTPWLERRCIDRLLDRNQPVPFLLVPTSPTGVDGRNIIFDNLRLWSIIRKWYAYDSSDEHYVLLRRRQIPFSEHQDRTIPSDAALQYGLWRRARGLFFRVARKMARVSYDDGSSCVYSANPDTLNQAPWPSHLPRNDVEMFRFLKDDLPVLPKVVSITFYEY